MNSDLKEQLDEMGPDYRDLVVRMRAAFSERRGFARFRGRWLIAAALMLPLGLAVVFVNCPPPPVHSTFSTSQPLNEYSLADMGNDEAMRELIRTQRADGSWKNEFLTRRNAEALRLCGSPEARISYKKAKRWLRCAR